MHKCHVHVALNRRKESLQPFIRGGIRKIADKELWWWLEDGEESCATSMCSVSYLEARDLFDLFLRSRRHAVLVDRGGRGVRHWGNELVSFGVG